ncbi:SDR family oxidoreductase [Polymorphum gilvum]|uniref:Oxidoreductase, short chain dehydrogenase/reductase family n=1 Tax=Polymorphum gilvum (strain LMG 25793 / CGMCC 1.9160 / SL003B-26A1) TaxID=991905 RepID=F2IZC8_POLGS|nr:SDR family oxidoreductase [Polymorphum gilvum]ADZ68551.1 Oxidoreductase, short chain dehydrogenase/reductase family [Polymorphum gilvum SL003B-26A1]
MANELSARALPGGRARTILITGCSSGIGASAARLLRGRNWRVFASARKDKDVAALQAAGFEAYRLDYEDADSIRQAAATVLERCDGRLDALFNNGAYAVPCAVEDLPTEALRALFEANFFGWHELTRQVLPSMRANGSGRIVQCSSILGFIAMKYRGAYTASKFALEAYSDTLRQELRGTGIHVSLIEPGPIDTRFTANALANFHRWIGKEGLMASPHRASYDCRLKRMEAGEPGPFKLPPEAVVKDLIHAVEAPRPRARYRVTVPTKAMAVARRLLSTRALDSVLTRAADKEE